MILLRERRNIASPASENGGYLATGSFDVVFIHSASLLVPFARLESTAPQTSHVDLSMYGRIRDPVGRDSYGKNVFRYKMHDEII